jgi:hypothetical protein
MISERYLLSRFYKRPLTSHSPIDAHLMLKNTPQGGLQDHLKTYHTFTHSFHASTSDRTRTRDRLLNIYHYDQNKNFRPTKCIPLPFDFANGSLRVQRTSASVGVSAIAIGVGT